MGPEGRIVQNYNELIAAFIDRRHDLGLTQMEIDYISGLHEGYTGKVESWQHKTSGRGLGILTLPLLMKALGVVIVVKPLARDEVGQMALPLEGQMELPLLGGKVNELPKEDYWVRVAPKRKPVPLTKAGKAKKPPQVQRPQVPSRKPAGQRQGPRKPYGNGSKPARQSADRLEAAPSPCGH